MSIQTHPFSRDDLLEVARRLHDHMAHMAKAIDPASIGGLNAMHDADAMGQIVQALESYPLGATGIAEAAVAHVFADLRARKGFAETFDATPELDAIRKHIVATLAQHVAGPAYPFGAPAPAAKSAEDLEFA